MKIITDENSRNRRARPLRAAGVLACWAVLAGCISEVDERAAITQQPADQTVQPRATATFSVAATGGRIFYQWLKDGIDLPSDTSAVLTLRNVAYSDSGSYACSVTNGNNIVVSSAAFLRVQTSWQPEQILSVGAQGNASFASAMDLDVPNTLSVGVADSSGAAIDLVFAFYQGAFHLMSPVAAFQDSISVALQYRNTIQDIKFVQVSAKPPTQEGGKALYDNGNPVDDMPIHAGDMFMVKTGGLNEYVYLKVNTLVGSDSTGSATLSATVGTL